MQKRYLVMAAVGGSAVWAVAGQISPAKTSLEFTKPALPAPASIELRAEPSPSHVVLPVELGPLAQRAEQALPEKLALIHDWLSDAACAKRNLSYSCTTARLDGTITRTGPLKVQVAPAMIKLIIPVKYALTLAGMGWASYLSEQKAGEANLDVSFSVTLNAVGGLDVAKIDDPVAADAPIALLKGNVRLTRLLEPRLKPVIKTAEDDLRRVLAALPVKAVMARAWDALAQPLELGKGSGLWLKGAPEYYSTGKFVLASGKLSYQIPMTSRAAITESERAPSNATRRNAVLSQELAPVGPSRVRIAVPVDLEALRQQADTAFGNGQIFESRADRFSEPVKVKVRATRVYPALRQIGLELDVDVTAAKGGTFSGKLNLAGRPVLDAATGTVTLVDITFPPVSGRDVIGQAPGIPRLGTEPFAAKFAAAAKLDVSRALAEVLPRAIHMLNQRLSDDLALEAKLTQAVPVSLELTRDGAWLLVDLTGDLAFVHDGANDRASLPGNPAATAPDATAATATTPPQTATPEKRPAAKKRPLQSKKTGSAKNT